MVPLEALQHVEDDFLNPAGPDQGTTERALTLAIAPVPARQPVIPGQNAPEDRRVAAPAAPQAAGRHRGVCRAAGANLPFTPVTSQSRGLMSYQQEVFVEQLPLVDCFARHLVRHRVIKRHLDERRAQSPFWSDTCNAHLLQASIYWCMVFGAPGPNPTHLRNLAAGDADALQASFSARGSPRRSGPL